MPSINFAWIIKHFSTVYIDSVDYVKVSKEGGKWKTRFYLTYFSNHQPYWRMHLQRRGPRSMCKCHFSVLTSKAKKKQKTKNWFCADQTVNKGMTREGNIQCRAHLCHCSPPDVSHSGADASLVSHFLIPRHEMVRDPYLILTT